MLTETKAGDHTRRVLINCYDDVVNREVSDVKGLEITRRPLYMYRNIEKIVSFYPYEPLSEKNYFYVRFRKLLQIIV